ncbi:MAG TPA: glycosyl hydrolase [Cellvibrionales bacterium]|mgnify:FL=1|jgi:exo-beta-1,3-glucanase (GH17 family)|nr:glycosyl hydrolase [Cellvibrionales bacterium]HAW13841.1 glycosyl hydrolase [Cellvibrionales bacterium]HCX26856.1 glycosyl hydrolase [Cellvibrionales bacterium]
MSKRDGKILSLSGMNVSSENGGQLNDYFQANPEKGMHGIGFSAYEEGQKPGDELSLEQVQRRMSILKPYVKWVRSFSCIQGNELIPMVARQSGLKTLVGAWLGKDLEKNELEVEALIKLAKDGYVDIAAVGNEVMYREDLTEEQLLDYIRRFKAAVPDVPVGYVDAYYEFEDRPAITDICDVILANCYPFWEGCSIEYSLLYMKDMYRRTQKAAAGKKVIITETGWPNKGQIFYGAQPSEENAIRYFLNAQHWAHTDNVDMFYFSSFDESWKVGTEGDVGAYWGLWDKNEKLKFV